MFVFKCLPLVGTAITAVEAVAAAAEGDGKKCLSKLAQTGVGAAMDTAFIMSGGFSSLATAPLQGAALEGGKAAGKRLMQQIVVREAGKLTTNVAVRGAAEYLAYKASAGTGGGGHSWNRRDNGGRRSRTSYNKYKGFKCPCLSSQNLYDKHSNYKSFFRRFGFVKRIQQRKWQRSAKRKSKTTQRA